VGKETYIRGKRDLYISAANVNKSESETYLYMKRDLLMWGKRFIYVGKEACVCGIRGLCMWGKRPLCEWSGCQGTCTRDVSIYEKRRIYI